ncbi:uncharacterized protein K452DRAFT_261562 [Aplosporella prunicola CBS 121167]|uniref:Uncharacterized protein n=1 Tax=Aplosporella prunicola CBS 121167 TaxID=1176127 RepID=A0A6A6BTB4_9PEZI|nr:uncharacterized protein K452DRAFT_261562 [Aplosporella prunicola CBS 121167]KAF2147230.1 hypothetical protein K452DRAFT_261562 [Aplosporella prunicola CBS 121167]
MFGFGGSSTLLAGRHDSAQERAPPDLPTPIAFPHFKPPHQDPQCWSDTARPSALFQRFARVKKPSDISLDHFAALNIAFEPECGFDEILSALPDGPSFLPPKSWLEDPATDAPEPYAAAKYALSSGRPYPGRDDFVLRLKEVTIDNHDAFSALTRTPPPGKKPPRLAHFRRFFEGLDNMAYYWDSSLDEYIPPNPEGQQTGSNGGTVGPEAASKQKLEDGEAETVKLESTHIDESEPRKKAKTGPFGGEDAQAPGQSVKLAQRPASTPATDTSSQAPTGTYKGLRIGSGRGMPDSYRTDTIRSFVEPIAWSFNLTLAPHRRPPALQVENLRMPVRVSVGLWKPSTDRTKARQGWLTGPVAGIRSGDYVDFGKSDGTDQRGQQEALLDVMREIGSLLSIAQERAREGRKERKPGEGCWWTTVPRWGGGSGGEVGEGRGDSDGPAPKSKDAEKEGEKPRSSSSRRVASRKKSAAEAWAELKPGAGFWDPKVDYEATGKNKQSEWDDVFVFSSLNTHVSLLHLHVHPAYISWLETGSLPSPQPADPSWCRPVLRRTRWYDFFNVDDRVEAMRGSWGVLGYLARRQENVGEDGPDVAMGNA